MIFVDRDPLGLNEVSIPAVTDSEYEKNCKYAEEQISEYQALMKQAMGSRHARNLRKSMEEYTTREAMDRIGGDSWKAIFDLMLMMCCECYIENQYRFSSPAFRKTLTEDVLLEKCKILRLSDRETSKLVECCVYREEADKTQ